MRLSVLPPITRLEGLKREDQDFSHTGILRAPKAPQEMASQCNQHDSGQIFRKETREAAKPPANKVLSNLIQAGPALRKGWTRAFKGLFQSKLLCGSTSKWAEKIVFSSSQQFPGQHMCLETPCVIPQLSRKTCLIKSS